VGDDPADGAKAARQKLAFAGADLVAAQPVRPVRGAAGCVAYGEGLADLYGGAAAGADLGADVGR